MNDVTCSGTNNTTTTGTTLLGPSHPSTGNGNERLASSSSFLAQNPGGEMSACDDDLVCRYSEVLGW